MLSPDYCLGVKLRNQMQHIQGRRRRGRESGEDSDEGVTGKLHHHAPHSPDKDSLDRNRPTYIIIHHKEHRGGHLIGEIYYSGAVADQRLRHGPVAFLTGHRERSTALLIAEYKDNTRDNDCWWGVHKEKHASLLDEHNHQLIQRSGRQQCLITH